MSYSCPINFEQIDANVSRFSAFLVAHLVVGYLISSNIFILYFLALDFILRLFVKKGCSPLFIIAQFFKDILKIKEKFTDGGAKRLAGYFGLVFVLLLILTHLLDLWILSLVIATIFLSCSLLDVIFNYCLGCKIYFIIKKIFPNFMQAN
jgi:hypothetical protein